MEPAKSIVICESIADSGDVVKTWIEATSEGLFVHDQGTVTRIGGEIITAILRRYGKPLEPTIALRDAGMILEPRIKLHGLNFRAEVDADSRYYLVLVCPGKEPLAALGTVVWAALQFLIGSASKSSLD